MRLYALAFFTVVAVAAVQLGCSSTPLTSPTGSTISMTSDRSVLPLNGQATLRAVVIESAGTPVHNGTVVSFTSTLGTVTPPEATTVNGVATTVFNAGSLSGTSVIHAFSGGARTGSGNTSSGGVEIKVGAAAAGSVSISATPSSVSQSGGTVTIEARVLDPSGNPLPGVNVTFSTDAGQLNPTTALSDSSGLARSQLTTTSTAKVKATAGTATSAELTVAVTAAPTVTIEAPATTVVGVPVAITIAAPAANSGARQLQSVIVDFGDGTTQTIANPTGQVGLTHTYRNSGGFTITARSTDVTGNTGIATRGIVVQPAVPAVSATANPQFSTAPFTTVISITASAATGGPPLTSVRAFVNGEQVYSSTSGNGSFAYRINTAGTYNVSVVATDAAGNEGRANTIVIAQ